DNPDFYDVLKKLKLPTKNITYNKEKLQRWAQLIRNEMEAKDKYGVLRLDTASLIRESKNGRYVTIATMKIDVVVYKSIYAILEKNPQYLLKIIYGIYNSLGYIIKFLEMEEIKEEGNDK
ncbi:MAG: hypothetical protein QXU98_05465, partial [Candidatus Parvarchaeota archaeon]